MIRQRTSEFYFMPMRSIGSLRATNVMVGRCTVSDCFRIAKVILLSWSSAEHTRCQPSVVSKHSQLATEVMRPNAGLHANQAWRHSLKAEHG
jgi:hypothetical protein